MPEPKIEKGLFRQLLIEVDRWCRCNEILDGFELIRDGDEVKWTDGGHTNDLFNRIAAAIGEEDEPDTKDAKEGEA